MDSVCHICQSPVAEEEILGHLERFHIGRRHFEWVHLSCGDCSLQTPLSEDSLRFMMRHFSASGHNPQSLKTDWSQFIKNENHRLFQLVSIGSDLETSKVMADRQPEGRNSVGWSKRRSSDSYRENSRTSWNLAKPSSEKRGMSLFESGEMDYVKSRKPIREKQQYLNETGQLEGASYQIREGEDLGLGADGDGDGLFYAALKKKEKKRKSEDRKYNIAKSPKLNLKSVKSESLLPVFGTSAEEYPEGEQNQRNLSQPEDDQENDRNGLYDSPKRSRPKREDSDKPLHQCTLCDFTSFQNEKARMLHHSLSHDKTLNPFKCGKCDFTATQLGNVRSHSKRKVPSELGCDGTYENIQTEEMVERTRSLLLSAFPNIDWDVQLPRGETLIGIKV